MKILREFLEQTDDNEVKSIGGLAVSFYKQNKNKVSPSEREDFQQDIILCILETKNKFDPSKGTFGNLLGWELRTLLHSIITRYVGVKMSFRQFSKFKQENRELSISSLQ